MNDPKFYESLLTRIVTGIAHKPVKITMEQNETLSLKFDCQVEPGDMSLLMGKKGRIIKAIQIIFRAIALHNRLKHIGIFLRCDTNDNARHAKVKPDWNEAKAIALGLDIVAAFGHQVAHARTDKRGHCTCLILLPEVPEPLFSAVNAVLEQYRQSYGKCFGLVIE